MHEGVGDVESFFLWSVPSANSLVLAAPDLNEPHFAQALLYVIRASNHSIKKGSSPPSSPAMVYYSSTSFICSGLNCFGAAGKALVHGESRGSKFENHAEACIYMGPATNSDSSAHCTVLTKNEYKDVDCGCVTIDEKAVLERTRRDHPGTQPYNQVGGGKTVDLGKPTSIFDLTGMSYTTDSLPHVVPVVWVRGGLLPMELIVVLLWHGGSRPGDMSAWVHEFGVNKVVPIPIDLKQGGQEHNLLRTPVKLAILELIKLQQTIGVFMSAECSPYSALRTIQPGPPVLFDLEHPDGKPDEDGELSPECIVTLSTARVHRRTQHSDVTFS